MTVVIPSQIGTAIDWRGILQDLVHFAVQEFPNPSEQLRAAIERAKEALRATEVQ